VGVTTAPARAPDGSQALLRLPPSTPPPPPGPSPPPPSPPAEPLTPLCRMPASSRCLSPARGHTYVCVRQDTAAYASPLEPPHRPRRSLLPCRRCPSPARSSPRRRRRRSPSPANTSPTTRSDRPRRCPLASAPPASARRRPPPPPSAAVLPPPPTRPHPAAAAAVARLRRPPRPPPLARPVAHCPAAARRARGVRPRARRDSSRPGMLLRDGTPPCPSRPWPGRGPSCPGRTCRESCRKSRPAHAQPAAPSPYHRRVHA
jgi:hypothetical protein